MERGVYRSYYKDTRTESRGMVGVEYGGGFRLFGLDDGEKRHTTVIE